MVKKAEKCKAYRTKNREILRKKEAKHKRRCIAKMEEDM